MIMFVILHVGQFFPPSQHISNFRFDSGRLPDLDVTLAWNERAKWIFLEAGDMCHFLACSLYCKKDRWRQGFFQLLNRGTEPKNIRLYIWDSSQLWACDMYKGQLGNMTSKHRMIFDLECKNRELPALAQTFYVCCIHNWALRLISA